MKSKELSYTTIEGVRDYQDMRLRPHVPDLISCIRSAFGKPGFDEWDIRNHLGGDLVILAHAQGSLVGYASTSFNESLRQKYGPSFPDLKGAYFAAGVVAQDYQHRGLYTQLNKLRVQEVMKRNQEAIFTRTQNPFVEAGIASALEYAGVRPQIKRSLVAGCYGHMLTASQPMRCDLSLARHYTQLDYGAGDAFVLVFDLNNSGENNELPLYFSTSW